jgi:hypothetical protein
MWLANGSTAHAVNFEFGKTRDGAPSTASAVDFIRVYRCSDESDPAPHAVWVIGRVINDAPVPSRIEYGVVPAGYEARSGPDSLETGCYVAEDAGSGHVRFLIAPDGSVAESPQS